MRVLLSILIISFLNVKGYAQTNDYNRKIDELIKSNVSMKQFNGNVLIVQKGKTIFSKSYGLADFEWNIPNDEQTKFKIGSNTKLFTSVLVMQLREQGKISLDSNINSYLPWYNKENGKKITVKNLLSHTSGLKNYTERPDFYSVLANLNSSPRAFAEKYCQEKELLFEPGTKYNYCNSDYYLLGLIIEAVTGKPYAQVLRENILIKAGMKNSGIDSASVLMPKRAKGYDYTLKGYINSNPINMATSTYAAGAMYATINDMRLWQSALQGNLLLSEESKRILYTPVLSNQAFGVFVSKMSSGKTVYARPGAINGYAAFLAHFVEDDISIFLLDNTSANTRNNSIENLAIDIYHILINQPYKTPKIPISIALTETYNHKGIQAAVQEYQKIKNDSKYDLSNLPGSLNSFGYALLRDEKIKEALIIFKMATEEFPGIANTLDSYAEALKLDRQYKASVDYYQRVLKIEPDNKRAIQEIEEMKALLNK